MQNSYKLAGGVKKLGKTNSSNRFNEIWKFREYYMFMVPAIIVTILFAYIPMYGITMAFQYVKIGQGFAGGEWIGFENFIRLFSASTFYASLKNTLIINIVTMLFSIPLPVILALMLHNSPFLKLKKLSQTASYLPYLLSAVVVVSILNIFCNGEFGLINILRDNLGLNKISFFGEPKWVLPMYVISEIWQRTGYYAVIYMAVLSGIDNSLIEAARIDGASKMKRIWYIDLPMLKPTIVILLILSAGQLMTMGIDKILLLQTDLNLTASETVITYVYKAGFVSTQYGFSTAVGLFNNVVNLIMLLVVNYISRKLTESSLF